MEIHKPYLIKSGSGEGTSLESDKGIELNHWEIRVRRLIWDGLKGSGCNQRREVNSLFQRLICPKSQLFRAVIFDKGINLNSKKSSSRSSRTSGSSSCSNSSSTPQEK